MQTRISLAIPIVALTLLALSPAARADVEEVDFTPLGNVDACAILGNGEYVAIGNGSGVEVFPVTSLDPLRIAEEPIDRYVAKGPVTKIVSRPGTEYFYLSTLNGWLERAFVSEAEKVNPFGRTWVDWVLQDIEYVDESIVVFTPDSLGRIRWSDPFQLEDVLHGVNARSIEGDRFETGGFVTGFGENWRLTTEPNLAVEAVPELTDWGGIFPVDDEVLLAGSFLYDRFTMAQVASLFLPSNITDWDVYDGGFVAFTNDNSVCFVGLNDIQLPDVTVVQNVLPGGSSGQIAAFPGSGAIVAGGGAATLDEEEEEPVIVRIPSDISGIRVKGTRALAACGWNGPVDMNVLANGAQVETRTRGLRNPLDVPFGAITDVSAFETGNHAAWQSRTLGPPQTAPEPRRAVYGVAGADGFVIFEDDGRSLIPVDRIDDIGAVRAIRHRDDVLFVVSETLGVLFYDLADPFAPQEIGRFETLWATDCVARGSILYVASHAPDNRIVDISDLGAPVEIGTFPGGAMIEPQGNRLYVPEAWAFRTYDISDPAAPTQIGVDTAHFLFSTGITPVPAKQTPAGKRYVWVCQGFDGVKLVDFTDPNAPVWIERFQTRDLAMNVALMGDYVLVADAWAGISVLHVTDTYARTTDAPLASGGAAAGLQLSNVPNPVENHTQIRFALPQAGPARLDVFDVTGRRVTTLLNGSAPAGSHAIDWDRRDESGRRVAAGAYFYRLTTAERSKSSKMIVVR